MICVVWLKGEGGRDVSDNTLLGYGDSGNCGWAYEIVIFCCGSRRKWANGVVEKAGYGMNDLGSV